MGADSKIIGRSPDCDLVVDGQKVSRRHAMVELVEGNLCVSDMNSTNGTFVNGSRIKDKFYLTNGDVLTIGGIELAYEKLMNLFHDSPVSLFSIDDAVEALKLVASAPVQGAEDVEANPDALVEVYIESYRKSIVEFMTILKALSVKSYESQNRHDVAEGIGAVADMMRKKVINDIVRIYGDFCHKYYSLFDSFYETASVNTELWQHIRYTHSAPISWYYISTVETKIPFFGVELVFEERIFERMTDCNHLILHYDEDSKEYCNRFVNTLLCRMYAGSSPSNVISEMIDVEELDGTCDIFKRLNEKVFRLQVNSVEVSAALHKIEKHIEIVVKNVLQEPFRSVAEYNAAKETKEPHVIIVIEGCPSGLNSESLSLLRKILKNGIRAGVNVILMLNEDELKDNETAQKAVSQLGLSKISAEVIEYDFCHERQDFVYLSDECVGNVVTYVNDGLEVKDDVMFKLTDYLPDTNDWWHKKSAARIDVPFGLGANKEVRKLCITQESGQNSAIVIGVPGSGKSVFLHSLILNVAMIYSPNELQMYLFDFSGVEFNTYALNRLPHARIIGPEAEREFGLSVLEELKAEGERRMNLCREKGVSNIVELKQKYPDIQIPRLLVIIDEFQKLFEVDGDFVSRNAVSCIHIIIQEFRKFGINLILATQKLPSSGLLPRDLIANRILFKSSSNDFTQLISSHKQPMLRTGECVYTSTAGDEHINVQTFLVTQNDREKILKQLSSHAEECGYEPISLRVFRSDEQPVFEEGRKKRTHKEKHALPSEVGVYLGEAIAIRDEDVHAVLRQESNNNILIAGGDSSVAEQLCVFSVRSVMENYETDAASFFVFNFRRKDDPASSMPKDFLSGQPFDINYPTNAEETIKYLEAIKDEIECRKKDESKELRHIYLTFVSFQGGRVFDPEPSNFGSKTSKASQLLTFIIQNGPLVGVFTIMHVDNLTNLSRLGSGILNSFNHRVAFQMTEKESASVMNDARLASRLFIYGRPYTKYRAYYRDNLNNMDVKFKPYM